MEFYGYVYIGEKKGGNILFLQEIFMDFVLKFIHQLIQIIYLNSLLLFISLIKIMVIKRQPIIFYWKCFNMFI